MKASTNARLLIEHYEGLVLHSYEDSVGVLTIGYGHSGADVHKGMVITQAEADSLLARDLAAFEAMLNDRLTRTLTQGEFDALMSFLYNVGPGEARAKKNGVALVRNGNYEGLVMGRAEMWYGVQDVNVQDKRTVSRERFAEVMGV